MKPLQNPTFTYQTRLALTPEQSIALDAYAALYSKTERSFFAAMQTAVPLNETKRLFQPRFGATARQLNSICIGLKGKINAIKARQPELIKEAEQRVNKAVKTIINLEKKTSACGANKLHQKKRRLKVLQDRLVQMKSDYEVGLVKLCFGSKKLFNTQFDLGANNYESHEERTKPTIKKQKV